MKKNKLIADYSYDFQLFGLLSYAREYKLAWTINSILNIGLKKEEDIVIRFVGDRTLAISNFKHETPYATVRLLRNRSYDDQKENSAVYLLPELKNFDYLLMVHDESDTGDNNAFSLLGECPLIQYLARIDLDKLKSRENLLFN